MLLLVGLGNPGRRYAANRHNIGFLVLDEIARRYGFGPWRTRFQGEVAEGRIGGARVVALKPQTFMNLSGQSVGEAMRFFKLEPEDVLVVHDEIDLAPGKLRVKPGGGAAGHNGIRDIIDHIGPDFRRLRLGVGHPGEKGEVHGHVLHDFAKADREWLVPLLEAVTEEFSRLVAGDANGFMSRAAQHLVPPRPKTEPKLQSGESQQKETKKKDPENGI
ncbi:MAG: aminoacyl-tRNA hydrolase [Kiloniellales bacterium]